MTAVISDNNSPFSIKKINIFSSWVFNLPKNTECTICRCSLNCSSLYNQEKGLDSYVVSGICQHSFHHECIKPWVDKNKLCPICFQKWEFSMNTQNIKEINIIKDTSKIEEKKLLLEENKILKEVNQMLKSTNQIFEENKKILEDEKKILEDEKKTLENKIKYDDEVKMLKETKQILEKQILEEQKLNDNIDLVPNENAVYPEVHPTNNTLVNVIKNINAIVKNKEINIIKATNTIVNDLHYQYHLYYDILKDEESDEMPPLIVVGPTGPKKVLIQKVKKGSKKNENSKGF